MSNQQPISTFLGIAAAVVLATNSHAADINVPGDQPTIQAGIDAAVNGDVVIVAQGEYFENINFNGKGITVRSTDPNDAGVVLNTIINGGGIFPTTVVTCGSGEGPDTVLSGFVITGGNAFSGGGMVNYFSSPTVTSCSFSGNTATDDGGGMYNFGSDPTITNCSFIGNTVSNGGGGGGMYNVFGSSPTVTNCSFSGNTAFNKGGGMYNECSSPTVTNCSFSGNTATHGGGMSSFLGTLTVTNCTFSSNTATDDGGGMYNVFESTPTVTNCSFSGNTATDDGGGMYNFGSSTVTNCSFSGNTAFSGGGMFNLTGTSPTLTNTGFCDNTPDQINSTFTDGGGNSLLYCPPPITKPNPCPTDTNGDGVTNVLDLIDVLLEFGTACP